MNNKEKVHNTFYAKVELIPNNVIYGWFKNGIKVKIILKMTDKEGLPYIREGKIIAMYPYEITLLESNNKLRVIFKNDISNIVEI